MGGWALKDYCSLAEAVFIWMIWLAHETVQLTKAMIFLLFCCPRCRIPFLTEYGQFMMYPYVLHLTCLQRMQPWLDTASTSSGIIPMPIRWWLAAITLSFSLNLVLASRLVRCLFSVFLEPDWLRILA